jgi:hypothetical protein
MNNDLSKPEYTCYATNEHFPNLRNCVEHLLAHGARVVIYPVEGQLSAENEFEIARLRRDLGVEVGDPVRW